MELSLFLAWNYLLFSTLPVPYFYITVQLISYIIHIFKYITMDTNKVP